jgi:hypothetical protein
MERLNAVSEASLVKIILFSSKTFAKFYVILSANEAVECMFLMKHWDSYGK